MWDLIRVAVAEDHPLLRGELAKLVQSQPDMELAGLAADGAQAVELAAATRPDVLLMDVSLPRQNGIEATRQVRARCPGVRVIAFSMHAGAAMAELLRRAGAADYVVKGRGPDVLLSALRTACAPQPLHA